MTDETYVTRREIDLLKAQADAERARMLLLLTELKTDIKDQFEKHEKRHEKDEAKRSSGRRWAVATVIAAVAAVDGPLLALWQARGR